MGEDQFCRQRVPHPVHARFGVLQHGRDRAGLGEIFPVLQRHFGFHCPNLYPRRVEYMDEIRRPKRL